jgi:hypothetical protein
MANGKFTKVKKRRFWPFALFMLIYAAVALTAIELGLGMFHSYIAAYEDSRPKHVLNGYMDSLTAEHVADLSQDVIDQVDHNIQSVEECREYIAQALAKGFSYAKKSSESTETKQVYVIRSGLQVVGQFTMEATHEDDYGFTYWEVTQESFDMSYLIGSTVSTVAPDHYDVTVNGKVLDSSYIVGEPMKYDALKPFYGDYELPMLVTYQAGPFLGDFDMITTDAEGKVLVLEEVEDVSTLAQNCSAEEVEQLDEFVDLFLGKYVTYMSGANKNAEKNLYDLLTVVVRGSDFESRMYGALTGQKVTQSKGDKITDITNNYFFKLEDGRYACDVTYVIDTTGKQGVVTTTNNVRIIVDDTKDGLRVFTVYNY